MNKIAKRVLGLALSLTLMLAMSVSVFAAGSPQGNGTVSSGTSNGQNVIFGDKLDDSFMQAAQQNMGKAPAGTRIVDIVDVKGPEGYVKGTAITITFNVAGVVAGQQVGVLHQKADGSWEYLNGTAGNGTITVHFPNGLSPVAFVVGGQIKTGTTGTTGTSPKTGEFGTTSVLAIIAVLAMGGAVACYRKREEVR